MSRVAAIAAMAAALLVGSLGGSIIAARTGLVAEAAGGPIFQVAPSNEQVNVSTLAQGFHPIVEKSLPAVVNISSTTIVKTSQQMAPFFNGPFGDFFGQQFGNGFNMPQEQRQEGEGSGVIVSSDGYILTNNHVVSGATEIKVTLGNKKEYTAKVIGTDPKTDIAVVKVDATGLPFLQLGDSSQLQVGDVVLAMGNPFGIGQTVTMGIVSATARHNVVDPQNYADFIQTDAAINPGNSGGAMVNMRGELVGINSAILSRSGGNEGIGFAIPSNLAKTVMEQIVKNGHVVRGWLGVMIQPVDSSVAKAWGLKDASGALVGDVTTGGPAAAAGIEKGDVITMLNNEKVADSDELRLKVATAKPGDTMNVGVVRNGKDMNIPVKLGEFPEDEASAATPGSGGSEQLLQGLQVQDLTPQLARQLGLPSDSFGAVISSVQQGSPAAEANLQRGDVVQEVNRKRVANAAEFRQQVRAAGSGSLVLLVNRGGNTHYVVVEQ